MNVRVLFFAVMYLQDQPLDLPLWSPSERLSARPDSDLDINLTLSLNFIFHVIDLPFSDSFLIGTENVMYFSLLVLVIIKLWS